MRIQALSSFGPAGALLVLAFSIGGSQAVAQTATLRFDRTLYRQSETTPNLGLALVVAAPECGNGGFQIVESTVRVRAEARGSALPGRDFLPLERSVPIGGSAARIQVVLAGLLLDDARLEGPERFALTLDVPAQARVRCLADNVFLALRAGADATVEIEEGHSPPSPIQPLIRCVDCAVSGTVGARLARPLRAALFAPDGQPIRRSGASVSWHSEDDRLRLSEGLTFTDADGIAEVGVVLGNRVGTVIVTASLPKGAPTTFQVEIVAATSSEVPPIPGDEACQRLDLLPESARAACRRNQVREILPDEAGAQADLGVEALGLQGRFVRGRLETGGESSQAGRTGVYTGVTESSGSRTASPREAGYDYALRGLGAGVDAEPVPGLLLGGAVGYLHGEAEFADAGGSLGLRLLAVSAYAAYESPRTAFHLEGFATWGRPRFTLERAVTPGGSEPRRAVSVSSGSLLELSFGGRVERPFGPCSLEARGFARWDEAAIDGFEESGAGDLDLAVGPQRRRSLVAEAGLRLRYSRVFRDWALALRLGADALHELADESRTIEWRFLRGPFPQQSFSVATEPPDRDYLAFEAELLAKLPGPWSTFLRVGKEAQHENLESRSLVLGALAQF